MLTEVGHLAIAERMTSVVMTGSRRSAALLMGATAVVLGLLVVFGIALSRSQQDSRATLETRMQQRAVLGGSVVDSLFATVGSQVPALEKKFSAPILTGAALEAVRKADGAAYMVVVDPQGTLLAASSGYTSQARRALFASGALARVTKDGYVLGNLASYGGNNVIPVAVTLNTPYGPRVLVEGLPQGGLGVFLDSALARLGHGSFSHNVIIDAHDTVVATNTRAFPVGHRFTGAAAQTVVRRGSADLNGRYYVEQPLQHSTWRIVLSDPDSVVFGTIDGLHKWIPWLILIAFALVGALALGLGWRVLHSAERGLAAANDRLESLNRRLALSNDQLERRAAELARSNAELDQFASIASHDLQEPLRKVRTFTERLAETEGEQLSEHGKDYLQRANHAAERMQGLVRDLLEFSRITTKPRPFTPVRLGEVVADVLEDLAVDLEESRARLDVGELPTIDADPLQMRQLMLNLIGNAIKFKREGVTPEVSIHGEVHGGQAKLEIADNGIGFEQQYASRIFRVFERLNGRGDYPGSGIGLALCHKIVGRHNGVISARSQPGQGATFTVLLPVKQPGGGEQDTAAEASEEDAEADLDQMEEGAHART